MVISDKPFAAEPIIDVNVLKSQFHQYYNCLSEDEIQPYKIIWCSGLTLHYRADAPEKLLLIYGSLLVIIKNINGTLSKLKLDYKDINFLVEETGSTVNCITIDYKSGLKERIFYDSIVSNLVNDLLLELRKKLVQKVPEVHRGDLPDPAFSDAEENNYPGALVARAAVMDKSSVLCSLKQKKLYDHPGLLFRKVITRTHFTIVCQKEILIFMEQANTRENHNMEGELLYISLSSLRNVSLEATGKGMLLKYIFTTERILELFYENERTDKLLKVMSYINSMTARS